MKKPVNLIILGDPASGKATQAAHFAKKYGLHDLDMGKEVMKPAMRARHDYAKTTAKGKLTPTGVVRGIFVRTFKTVPKQKGILFDGTPKMIGEAKFVARLLREHGRTDPIVIYLHIPVSEVLRRMLSRTITVRGKIMRRHDDTVHALMNRRKYYKEQVSRTVEYFKKRYPFHKVSGMGTPAEVRARIESIIARHIKDLEKNDA